MAARKLTAPRTPLLVALLLAALLLAALPAGAHGQAASGPGAMAAGKGRFQKAIWGPIRLQPGQGQCQGPERCSAFPYYKELGVDVFQFQIEWNEVARKRPKHPRSPKDPAYWWSQDFDLAMKEAKRSGIRLAAMIKGAPPWANGGRSPSAAPRAKAYADFAAAASRRFPRIGIWMVWGEPSRAANFVPQGSAGARRYAAILDAAYGALKGVDRGDKVVGGMTLTEGDTLPPAWIKGLRLRGNRRPRMDWYGHNPFQQRKPRLSAGPVSADGGKRRGLNDVDTLWRELQQAYRGRNRGRRPHGLWLSEFTVQTDSASWAFPFYVSRSEQARRLRKSFALARGVPYVRGMGWFSLTDYPPAPNNPTWGLMSYDGERKPSYQAYRALP